MKKILIALSTILLLSACVAGDFEEKRERLHNMGKEDICQQNPQRCIKGTNIDW